MRNLTAALCLIALVIYVLLSGTLWQQTEAASSRMAISPLSFLPKVHTRQFVPESQKESAILVLPAQPHPTSEAQFKNPLPTDESIVEKQIDPVEVYRKIWENRRLIYYSELNLSENELETLHEARQEFYAEISSSILIAQSPESSEEEAASASQNIDDATQAYDSFVRDLVGPERFEVLSAALEKMNSDIASHSAGQFQFISAW